MEKEKIVNGDEFFLNLLGIKTEIFNIEYDDHINRGDRRDCVASKIFNKAIRYTI